jgi:hypothetical protein
VSARASKGSASWRRFAFCLLAVLVTLGVAGRASAEQARTVAWDPEWPRFRPAEIAVTAGLSLQAASAMFLYPAPKANWHGGILWDDAVRDGLRLHSRSGRQTAGAISDAIYYGLLAYPLVVDAGIVAGGVHGSGDVAVQMLAMDLESFALAGAIALTAEKLGRVRPEERGCRTDPNYSKDCGKPAQLNSSFMSGHTTIAFTGAGLICAHHQNLPLYGGGAPDLIACITALTAATTAGALRISSDKHYSTDVLLGMGVGLFSGYALPTLLHYGAGGGDKKPRAILPAFHSQKAGIDAVLSPQLGPESVGVTLLGTF